MDLVAQTMTDVVLRTHSLVKRFGGITATNNVSLEVTRGARHALIGPNGAGKTTLINPQLREKYGIEIPSFILENCSVPPEVEAAIDKRSSMGAIGNLNDYVKYQMAQGLAQPGKGGGVAGSAAELAMGFGLAQQMMNQPGGMFGGAQTTPAANPPAAPAASSLPDVLTPADVAKALGVTEADVLETLEKGDLKGRKIGAAWRVTRGALDEFLKH